jgi:hypothetical protein
LPQDSRRTRNRERQNRRNGETDADFSDRAAPGEVNAFHAIGKIAMFEKAVKIRKIVRMPFDNQTRAI